MVMGQSFGDLLDDLVEFRDSAHRFRNDPDREEARMRLLESIIQTMLEKLRDIHDRR